MILWIAHIIALSLLSYLGFRYIKSNLPTWVYWCGLALKLSAGIILGLIFYNYYGFGDTISFFELARDAGNTSITKEPRTQFFIQLLAPVVWISGSSYWITSLWLSWISFIACWFGVTQMTKLFPTISYLIAASFLFIPSIVFWSSGILKDALAFSALMILVTISLKWYKRIKIALHEIIVFVGSGYVLLQIKHYMFITWLLFAGIITAISFIRRLNGKWKWAIASLVFIISVFSTQFVHPYLKYDKLSWALFENNKAILEKSDPEDQLDIVIENATFKAVINEVPRAFHVGLFRPSIYDQTPIWGWLHRLENLILTIMIIMSLLLSVKMKPMVDWPLLLGALVGILLLATMLPLSTPNFGTLVRYKNAYMPYLFLISSILPYQYLTSQTEE